MRIFLIQGHFWFSGATHQDHRLTNSLNCASYRLCSSQLWIGDLGSIWKRPERCGNITCRKSGIIIKRLFIVIFSLEIVPVLVPQRSTLIWNEVHCKKIKHGWYPYLFWYYRIKNVKKCHLFPFKCYFRMRELSITSAADNKYHYHKRLFHHRDLFLFFFFLGAISSEHDIKKIPNSDSSG